MKVFRVWRYVLASTDEQAAQMRQCAGVVRLVYNLALEQRRARRLSHTPAPQSELGDDPSPENRPGPLPLDPRHRRYREECYGHKRPAGLACQYRLRRARPVRSVVRSRKPTARAERCLSVPTAGTRPMPIRKRRGTYFRPERGFRRGRRTRVRRTGNLVRSRSHQADAKIPLLQVGEDVKAIRTGTTCLR